MFVCYIRIQDFFAEKNHKKIKKNIPIKPFDLTHMFSTQIKEIL